MVWLHYHDLGQHQVDNGSLIKDFFKRVVKTAVIVILVLIAVRVLWLAGRFWFGG